MASSALNTLLKVAVVAAATVLFAYHGALESATLRLAEPMGYPEVVYRGIADVWPRQYQEGNFVATQDNYGPGFSTFCRPFVAMGFDPYVAARIANMAALVGATLLLAGILRSNRTSWIFVAAITSVFFALNAGSSSIQARPDFLATLMILVVLGLGRPAWGRRLQPALGGVLLGLAGLAAYLTKPYCLLAWGAAITFPFVDEKSRRDVWRSLTVAIVSTLVIGIGVAAYAAANPYFLMETVMFHFVHRDPSFGSLVVQTRDFAILGCGLVAVVVVAAGSGSGGARRVIWPPEGERRYWTWALALGIVALASGLGWHRGAYLTYFHHLILPPLAVVAAFAVESLPLVFSGFALIANIALLMRLAPPFPPPDRDWDALAADIARQRGPIVVDYMMEPLVRGRPDARVAGNGINRFALDAPDLIGGDSAVVAAARREVTTYVENERALIRMGPDPQAIYMDCFLFAGRPGDPRVPPRGYLAVPRNDHPLLLNGYDMGRYAPLRLFVIHPYYGSQNSPRQDAGKWILTIVKFVRIGEVPGDARGRLPFVLVPPAP